MLDLNGPEIVRSDLNLQVAFLLLGVGERPLEGMGILARVLLI